MKTTKTLALVLGVSVLLQACNLSLGSGSIGGRGPALVHFETRIEPWWPLPPLSTVSVLFGDGDVSHHVLLDESEKTYFGYDITVEPAEDPGSVRITLRELTATPEQFRREHPEEWTQLPSPNYPGPRILRDGDTIVVPLLINHETGQRIVDYMTIHWIPWPESASAPAPFLIQSSIRGREADGGSLGPSAYTGRAEAQQFFRGADRVPHG